jgi:two-component system phosphate regulon response regulator PhoB
MATRILIVEDDHDIALLLRYNLESAGFIVDHTSCGDDAEQLIDEVMPDLVLLDWLLPGTSGIELCRRIRSNLRFDKLPIIMMTARTDRADREFAMRLGADDFLTKPFYLSDVLARARLLTGRMASVL